MMQFLMERIDTPIGRMIVVTDADNHLRATDWTDFESRVERVLRQQCGSDDVELRSRRRSSLATRALRAYFTGNLNAVSGIKTLAGGTDFQRRVWKALRRIPVGDTMSYGELATRIGRPGAPRAVGLANGANPISIVVPCHRVIGADGSLTGYDSGIERKRWLLAHERGADLRP